MSLDWLPIVIPLSLLLIGFSVFSALALGTTQFSGSYFRERPFARLVGGLLLMALVALQLAHFAWLYFALPWVDLWPYQMLLFLIAPLFLLLCQPLLLPEQGPSHPSRWFLHAGPCLLPFLLPRWAILPVAFLIGAGYLLWFGRSLYALRGERANYSLEMSLLGGTFALALGVAVLALFEFALPGKLFYSLYATAIGLAFLLLQVLVGLRPLLPEEMRDVAQRAYANSTLSQVDCDSVCRQLDKLMLEQRLYEDAQLKLSGLASRVGLSTHQLSELLNNRLGKGFSRYLREQRIAAAKKMLCEEASSSVLAVGLSVGFTSQSNFYEAFREIEGMTPGQYRRVQVTGR